MWALTAIERRLASKTFGSALFLTVGGVFLVVGILDLRETHTLILMLVAAGAGIALPFFLIPRLPPRGRHEYLLEGQVLSIALDRKEASIKHDAVNGFRPATTMSYNVPDEGELAALKPGDLITATLVVVRDDIHLDDIKKVVAAR